MKAQRFFNDCVLLFLIFFNVGCQPGAGEQSTESIDSKSLSRIDSSITNQASFDVGSISGGSIRDSVWIYAGYHDDTFCLVFRDGGLAHIGDNSWIKTYGWRYDPQSARLTLTFPEMPDDEVKIWEQELRRGGRVIAFSSSKKTVTYSLAVDDKDASDNDLAISILGYSVKPLRLLSVEESSILGNRCSSILPAKRN